MEIRLKKKSSFKIARAFSILSVSTEIALCMKCHKAKIAITSEEILTLEISSYFKIYVLLVKKEGKIMQFIDYVPFPCFRGTLYLPEKKIKYISFASPRLSLMTI